MFLFAVVLPVVCSVFFLVFWSRLQEFLKIKFSSLPRFSTLGVILLMTAACSPIGIPQVEPAIQEPAQDPVQEPVQEPQTSEVVDLETESGEDSIKESEIAQTDDVKEIASGAGQSALPAKPAQLFSEDEYGIVLFTLDGEQDMQRLVDLTAEQLRSVLVQTGALESVVIDIEYLPEESGGEWSTAMLGGRIGVWITAPKDNDVLSVQSRAYFPDVELLLGEGQLGIRRTSEAMLEPFTASSTIDASKILADRLGVIVNAYIGYDSLKSGNHTECARRFGSAIALIDRVDVSYNRADASHGALGQCMAALGKSEEAKSHFEQALAINPDVANAYYGLGNYYFEKGDYDTARHNFSMSVDKTLVDALATEKTEARAYVGLGNVALALGNYEEAISFFDKSIVVVPDFPAYYLARGLAKQALGREDASADYEMCIGLVEREREPSDYYEQVALECSTRLEGEDGNVAVAPKAEPENPTVTPTTSPGAEIRDEITFQVSEDFSSINVRSGPDNSAFSVVGYLFAGDLVQVVARTRGGNWYLVQLNENIRGWVASSLLIPISVSSTDVPIAATVPPVPVVRATSTPRRAATPSFRPTIFPTP
ncbi:MAG: tetratricopeptide repeat protein, partial [Anaerolineaceae bacterium]